MHRSLINILFIAFTALLTACNSAESERSIAANGSAFSDTAMNSQIMAKWSRSCALCHISGEANAPIVGDVQAWQSRLARGEESVLTNVLEGYNSMPPLGYCMACEIEDFRAMIAYMAGTSQ